MSDCNRFEEALETYLAGDREGSDVPALLAHCRACEACGKILDLDRELEALGASMPEPDEAQLSAVTARVVSKVGLSRVSRFPRQRSRPAARVWLAAAVAASVLLFIGGFALGRALPRGGNGEAANGIASRLVAAMGAEAASNRSLADVEDSRFSYSNVSLRSAGEGRLALDFDVSMHVRLVEPSGSELAREVIVQALLNPSNTGARLRALSYTAGTIEPKVREALIFSMRRDPSLAVRLKALERLSDHIDQPAVEAAVLDTLRDDESVQMRLLALESLATHRVNPDRIRDVIREGDHPGDEALLVRLTKGAERL